MALTKCFAHGVYRCPVCDIRKPTMTRMEAEQLALVKGRNDKANNYVAENDGQGGWTVKAYPVHRGIVKGSD